MPRKVSYGIDYDDYEDYYDDFEVEENDVEPDTNCKATNPGIWRCSICTYDNDENMSACDICGVLRGPVKNNGSSNDKRTAPFKFDAPSPDDFISKGLRSSTAVPKANTLSDFSSNAIAENGARKAQPSAEKLNTPVISKGKDDRVDGSDSSLAKGRRLVNPSNSAPSISMPNGRDNGSDESHGSLLNVGQPENHTISLGSMALNSKPDHARNNVSEREMNRGNFKPEKWVLPDQAEGTLTQLNLAIVGHVDSGKSTLSGRLLHLLGKISQKQMHKFEKEAKLQGKGSFAYAWALDESAEERERGITMTVAVAYFDSKKYHVVVLDSPGHKDFVPNMISGATQADAAILVIDASTGSFEVGMDSAGGQTREHAQLIRSFGVEQIIVAVNKMDAVAYSMERFDLIKVQLGSFLHSCGFKDTSVAWVPLSAMENQNLVSAASDGRLSWYKGPCLLDAIDSLQPPARDFSKPLVMPICDVIRSRSLGQVSACGKLEAGALRIGSKVIVMPSGDAGTVRSLEHDSRPCSIARAGDNVAVTLQGIDGSGLMAGDVLCHPDFPVAMARHVELKVLVLEAATPILVGSQLEFLIHHAKEAAQVVKIVSLIDPKSGKAARKAARCLTAKQSAVIEVVLQGAVCAEEFSNCRALGRVFLRASGRTVAVGIVNRLIQQ